MLRQNCLLPLPISLVMLEIILISTNPLLKKIFQMLTTKTSLKEQELEARAFYDGSAETIQLTDKKKFKIETFLPMIDILITHLKQQSDSYKEINQRSGFLFRLKTIKLDELKNSCKEFAEIYHDDINTEELESECLHLT